MFQHNIILFYRNFRRFKSTFFINLTGLSLGLTSALLIYLWVMSELRVDKFLRDDERIFQVLQNTDGSNGIETMEATPGLLAQALKAEIPAIEYSTAVIPPSFNSSKGIISIGNRHFKAAGQYVSRDFFQVFPYVFIHGDRRNALSDKNGVVISKELALKLFSSTENALGKSLEWNAQNIKVSGLISGVFESLPPDATSRFDILLSFEKFEEVNPSTGWSNNGPRTYVLLKEGIHSGETEIRDFIKSKDADSKSTLFLQRYSDRYLHGQYENGVPSGGRIEYVRLFAIIGIFILVIACINFMNLQTAKSFQKAREVGIKKTFGARRRTLIRQFLVESLLMSFLGLIIAILFTDLLMTQFNHITGKNLSLGFDMIMISSLLAIGLVTGIISGSYPAFYLSRFPVVQVLKGRVPAFSGEHAARRGLVAFQFAVSVVLIVTVLVVNSQMKFIQEKNLGFTRDAVVYFETPGMNSSFLGEIKNTPGVMNAGGGRLVPGGLLGGTSDVHWEGKDPDDATFFTNLWMCYGFMETLDMTMAEGSTFAEDFGSHDQVILNETAVRMMDLKDAVGRKIKIGGEERQVVGVVKDFHFASLYETIRPCILLVAPIEYAPNVSVKMEAGGVAGTLRRLRSLYQNHYPGQVFDVKFMDDDYRRLYSSEQRVASLSRYFAALAIFISCLGLFGLAAFTAERRTKEIGIRKVLGSSVTNIVYSLSRDFTSVVAFSLFFSIPISYLLVSNWLGNFAFRVDIHWWYFVCAGAIALFIAWITIAMQVVKAARVNPAKCLRNE